ncbi:unnamed protein product [Rhizopus stolonifer]
MSFFKVNPKGVDAYTRHKQLIHAYLSFYRGIKPNTIPEDYRTERNVIKENHKSGSEETDSWEQRVAKKYYDTLFKEYAICELKYYKEGKIALNGVCESDKALESWEVNFGYVEKGEKKNELVKVRLCPECSDKLNYKTKKRVAKRQDKKDNKKKRRLQSEKRSIENSSDEGSVSDEEEDEKEKADNVWSKTIEVKEEKSKEEEYEDYFKDLLQ